tara:strand:- start:3781 stop:4413 length:633 start_codon:yes stop_codon:yes gene_type:complete
MGTNYYDPWLFTLTEESLNISPRELEQGPNYVNLPTTTYAQYKTEVNNQYNTLTPLSKILCDFHMSALTEVVSSGITTDPDYWSASSANGSFIVNSGLTTSKVGIGTIIPNHELSISGSMSASSHVYVGSDLYVDMIRRASTSSSICKIKLTSGQDVELYAGSSSLWSAIVASHTLKVGQNGDGFISAQTINAPVLSATTIEGTIDGGSF